MGLVSYVHKLLFLNSVVRKVPIRGFYNKSFGKSSFEEMSLDRNVPSPQINMPLARVERLNLLSKVPNLIFPIMWADETAQLDSENAEEFKSMVLNPTKVVDGVAIGLGIVVGGILVVVGLLMIFFKRKRSSNKTTFGK